MPTLIKADVLERVSVVHEFEHVSAVREFLVKDVNDVTVTDRPFSALAFASIPKVGDAWPGHTEGGGAAPPLVDAISFDAGASLVCVRRECKPLADSPDQYRITCYYDYVDAVTGPPQNPTITPSPSTGHPYAVYLFSSSLVPVETSEGSEGPVSGTGPFGAVGTMKVGYAVPTDDQPPEQVVVAQKQEVINSYIFKRHEDRHPDDSGMSSYLGKINSHEWNGLDPYRAMCTRISAEPQFGKGRSNREEGDQSYITTYEFQAFPNAQLGDIGYDIIAVYKDANGNPIASPVDNQTKKRFRLYNSANFNAMNLIPTTP